MQRPSLRSASTPRTARLTITLLSTVGLVAIALTGTAASAHDPGQTTGQTTGRTATRVQAPVRTGPDVQRAEAALTVVARPRAPKAPKPKGTTKVLVAQLYWKGTTPVDQRAAYLQKDVIGPNAWYRTVSHGRYGVTGSVTPPLPVRAMACSSSPHAVARYKRATIKALAHARYKLKHYGRLVIELPCAATRTVDGRGDMPGKTVWLFRDPAIPPLATPPTPAGATAFTKAADIRSTWYAFQDWTVTWSDGSQQTYTAAAQEFGDPVITPVHEMGHNLGLDHAHLLQCSTNGRPTSFGGHCRTIEYGDPYDTMDGEHVAGSFSAPSLKRLHWLRGKVKHVHSSATVALSPLEGTSGTQAITVSGKHGRTYWIELRTRTGVDAPLDPAQAGVLVHYTKPRSTATWLVDALPGSSRGWDAPHHLVPLSDAEQSELLPGHTLTTPEGITITTVSQASGSAVVHVALKHATKHHHTKHHHKKKHHKGAKKH